MFICLLSYDILKSVFYFDEFYFIIFLFYFFGKCYILYLVKFDFVVYEKNVNYVLKKFKFMIYVYVFWIILLLLLK